ncbi:MAG: class III lanthionine synthetase LanKC [Nocardioidaceae bacterium]
MSILFGTRDYSTYVMGSDLFFEQPLVEETADLVTLAKDILPRDWRVERASLWVHCQPPGLALPEQGWKIHVSTDYMHRYEILTRTARVALEHRCAFKAVGSTRLLQILNSKWMSRTAAGKFVTLYPRDDDAFATIMCELTATLHGYPGPYILTDAQDDPDSCVYYRYGAFKTLTRLNPDGTTTPQMRDPDGSLVPDPRAVPYSAHVHADNPLPGVVPTLAGAVNTAVQESPGARHIGTNYQVERALHFSAGGGVYLGRRVADDVPVVLKEGRPHTGWHRTTDTVARLNNEYACLERLAGVRGIPHVFDLFTEWQNTYLVEQYIAGTSLGALLARSHPLLRARPTDAGRSGYRKLVMDLWNQLDTLVLAVHDRGVVIGDLSLNNLLWDPAKRTLHLIDLETGATNAGQPPMGPLTHGFFLPWRSPADPLNPNDDLHAVRIVKLASLMPVTNLLALAPGSARAMLRRASAALELEEEADDLLADLHDTWLSATSAVTVAARPATDPHPRIPSHEFRENVPQNPIAVTEGLYRAQVAHLTPHRQDRLLPSDYRTFLTNPLSVAWGAAGVLRSWHYCDLPVPAAAAEWFQRNAEQMAPRLPPGLLTGRAGVAWTLLELGAHASGERLLLGALEETLDGPSLDFAEGVAGVGMACLKFWAETGEDRWADAALRCAQQLRATQQQTGNGLTWAGWRNRQYLGLAHGSSGVALFALHLSQALPDGDRWLALAIRAADFDLAKTVTQDGVTALPDSTTSGTLYPGWSRGTAGLITVLSRLHHVVPDPDRFAALIKLTTSVASKFSSSPGLFNGIAGFINCLLDLRRFTPEVSVPDPADLLLPLTEFLSAGTSGLLCPGERLFRYSFDYATGSAGLMCVLHRLATDKPDFNFTLSHLLLTPATTREGDYDAT